MTDNWHRIHVTGNAGAGKTTLAAELGRVLNLPVFGLDAVVWQPGWRKTPPPVRAAAERALVVQQQWVIDGVSHDVREAADLVIFLDRPRWRCLQQAVKRNLPYLFRSRPGLPDACPEIRILPTLVSMIWRFPARIRGQLLNEAQAMPDRYRILRSRKETRRFLEELAAQRERVNG
ncbi:MAG: topology modulation protein [Pseudomonadota bacterium]